MSGLSNSGKATASGIARTRTALMIAALLFGSICLAGSCFGSVRSKSRTELGIDGQPVTYPAGWPIQELTAPAGSERALLLNGPGQYAYAHLGGMFDRYDVGYSNALGFEANLEHVKQIMSKHGSFTEQRSTSGWGDCCWLFGDDNCFDVGLVFRDYTGGDVYQLILQDHS